jgi:hypothetical protein
MSPGEIATAAANAAGGLPGDSVARMVSLGAVITILFVGSVVLAMVAWLSSWVAAHVRRMEASLEKINASLAEIQAAQAKKDAQETEWEMSDDWRGH